jgi:hypothetical protein
LADRPPVFEAPSRGSRRPSWWFAAALGLSASVLFHCSVPAKEAAELPASGSCKGCESDAGRDALAQEVGVDAQPDADSRNALCGTGGCNPDEAVTACSGAGNAPSSGGAAGAAGQGAGGITGAGPALGCHVVKQVTGSTAATPVAVCSTAGGAKEQEPCQSQTDCGPALACVGALGDSAGKCRPYCCYGQESCGPGTYCTLVRAFEVTASVDALRVPACMVAGNCRLLDSTACDPGLACTFVDGATTCLPAGSGTDGAACPCAAGYVCLQSTGTCRRVCHERADAECGSGTCVSGGGTFPEGFGVCSN